MNTNTRFNASPRAPRQRRRGYWTSLLTLFMIQVFTWSSPNQGHSQVVVSPNDITGTIRLSNARPTLLTYLTGDYGMTNAYLSAVAEPPATVATSTTGSLLADGPLQTDYSITVDSANPGIVYNVEPRINLNQNRQVLWLSKKLSAPVLPGVAVPPLDFTECLGAVMLRFVDADGAPVAVSGGRVDMIHSGLAGRLYSMPDGSTQYPVFLLSDREYRLNIVVNLGSDFYRDRLDFSTETNVTVDCDSLVFVDVVLPSVSELSSVTGEVRMEREFEWTIDGRDVLNYPDFTGVILRDGPFGNQRWDALVGDNLTVPSRGSYKLGNVMPTDLDPTSRGYQAFAEMAFRAGRQISWFRSPALGRGSNPALEVPEGTNVDLDNLFVFDPGYIRGNLLLQGPSEALSGLSLFRGIKHAGDDDANEDGIPDLFGTYKIYWSSVSAQGQNTLASDASYTASYGYSRSGFDGTFNPTNGAFEGAYELVMGGLNGENSIWNPNLVRLVMRNGTEADPDNYYNNGYSITDRRTNNLEIVPGQTLTNDINYCLSKVTVTFRSTAGTFYFPRIRFSTGEFAGTDFLGQPADYRVSIDQNSGTPTSPANASTVGQVVMFLPQGTYRLNPYVTATSTPNSQTGLEPIDIVVGCGQDINVETCLQLRVDAPECSTTRDAVITGSVSSCSNAVERIVWSINGGPEQEICRDCGVDPSFSFTARLNGECAENILTVTAIDELGGRSSITTSIRYDGTAPVINCPEDIRIACTDTNGAIVNFEVSATDNCGGPVSLECFPPSGSRFPVGVTTVRCVATDACGNVSECQFDVTVGGSGLTIERAIILRWECGGTLQQADAITGPWVDVPGATSPHCVPTTAPRKFYRIR